MKSSNAKKASITIPTELEKDLKKLAKEEHRTLSGILQEAARYYLNVRKYEALQRTLALQGAAIGIRSEEDVSKLIRQIRKT